MELVGLQLDPLYNGSLRSMAVLSSRAQERRSREIRARSTTEESGHRKEVAVSGGSTVPCVNEGSVLSKMWISVRFSVDVLLPESAHGISYNL